MIIFIHFFNKHSLPLFSVPGTLLSGEYVDFNIKIYPKGLGFYIEGQRVDGGEEEG